MFVLFDTPISSRKWLTFGLVSGSSKVARPGVANSAPVA